MRRNLFSDQKVDTFNWQVLKILWPYLLEFKVRSLRREIETILTRWNQNSIESFQAKTRAGDLSEAPIFIDDTPAIAEEVNTPHICGVEK